MVIQSPPPNDHTHANKSALDGISSTKVSNWDSAYSLRHSHSNKSVLDNITSDMTYEIFRGNAAGNIILTSGLISNLYWLNDKYLAVYLGWDLEFSTNPYTPFDNNVKTQLLSKNIKRIEGIASLTQNKSGGAGLTVLANIEINVESNSGKITDANGELIDPNPNDDSGVHGYYINCAYCICHVYE